MIDAINEMFLAMEVHGLEQYAQQLMSDGVPRDEANRKLEAYRVELEQWRINAMDRITRRMSEPAPSHTLQ